MAILNNLYPPTVPTYAPAFLVDSGNILKDTCRIYFSISLYNSYSDIASAQVTVCNQNTNVSVLDETKYPCDIMLTRIYEDITRASDDRYYIDIKKTDIAGGKFEINQYYKVQIRFTSTAASGISFSTPQAIDSWLATNLPYFSEWSTVCLVRGISTPRLQVNGFDATADSTMWTTPNIDIIGTLTFADALETETLRSYRIRLYSDTDELLTDTGDIFPDIYVGVNQLNYTFKRFFQDGEEYRIVIDYITTNLYSDQIEYNFYVVQGGADQLNATLSAIEDEENGRIGINIKGNTTDKFIGNITIRRTSSESNFTIWEDIHTVSIENQILDYTWYDSTIESGIWYRYCAQKRNSLGNRGVVTYLEKPHMLLFDDMYLTGQGQQLNIKFNPQVSSYKRQISESKVDTIGSKFPFIKRNGYTNYKTFPISGTISHWMDKDHLITSREKIFDETIGLYDEFNEERRITPLNDYTYEREFRKKVEDFLYSNTVKLFRSATEGNILVKIMDINFTPNQTLGRMIYDFSCMAYEVADYNIENCDIYKIQTIGEYDEHLAYEDQYIGQINEIIPAGKDVIQILQEKYNKYAKEGYITKIEYLDHLRIEMEDKPYLINEDASGPYPINDKIRAAAQMSGASELASAYLGYIMYVNSQPIVINPEGIYELKNEDVRVISLTFPVDTKINIDYHVSISQTEDQSQLAKTTNFYKKMGQCWGAFSYEDSIFQKIWNKYYEKYTDYMQSLISINGLRVEANPGTVVYVKESGEKGFERHIIGDTCSLDFWDPETVIEGIYFAGIHLEEATPAEAERDNPPDNRFIDTGEKVYSLEGIENPVRNGVYYLTGIHANNYPFESKYNALRVTGVGKDREHLAMVKKDRTTEIKTGVLAMILNKVVVIIEDDTILCDAEDIEYIRTVERMGYKVITKGSEEANNLVYVLKDRVQTEADKNYSLLINKVADRDFALTLYEMLESDRYIWYNDEWWLFTDNNDLLCPVTALIDYQFELMKGMYVV